MKKVQAVQAYLGTMMRMFKVKGTALKSYAKKKLSQRINKNANCIFQDRAFSQAINWKNGLLQGFVLMKSIKKFKKGAKNAISRNEKLKSILDQKIKNSIDSPQKISPLFDKICSENNLALIIQNLEENEKLQTPQEKEEVNDIFAKVGKWKDEMPSISNSFVKENCKIISILEQMEKVNINSAQDIKLISFIKNKYDENKL